MPAAQLTQLANVDALVAAPYSPASHAVQWSWLVLAWKWPVEQLAQAVAPAAEYLPAAQLAHMVTLTAPTETE